MASPVRVINGKFAGVQGNEAVQRLLADIPTKLQVKAQAALNQGAERMVDTFKQIAPVATPEEAHPGQLRESAHVEANGRALSVSVVVDPKDASGRGYAAHVEYGHKDGHGGHVPAKQAFWPSYRVNKKALLSDMRRVLRDTVKGGE